MKVLKSAVSRARSPMSHNPIAHHPLPLREATNGLRLCVLMLEIRQSLSNSTLHNPSRSPSATEASGLAAVYQDWPLLGFLKSTRIGNNATFNLEFHLVDVPEHLELSAPFIAWHNGDQSSIQPRKPRSITAYSKTRNCQSTPPRKRAPWTTEEDTTLVKMKAHGKRSLPLYLPIHKARSRYATPRNLASVPVLAPGRENVNGCSLSTS